MSNFRSYVKFCKPESSAAFLFLKLAPRWGDSYYIIVSTSGFDVLIECTDFMYVPIHSPKMKNIIYFWPLGALGRFLQLARSCHRITLIEPYPLSSTSHCTLPWGRDSHDLLRQQSENVFSRSKIWWIMRFSAVFLDFLIFFNFGSFWDALAINFDLLAWFPPRGWSQISLGLNFKLVQVRACPNSFFWGRMFRSRCLGHSQTCRYAQSPKNTKRIWFLQVSAQMDFQTLRSA